jgi:hypothetical protein
MTYRLAFIRTNDGYLKVFASAKGHASLTAIHVNPDVLMAGARLANLSELEIDNLNSAAERAWLEEAVDVCCEAIELNADQLKSLGFIEGWRRLA